MSAYLKKFIPFAILIAAILFSLNYVELYKPVMQFAWICYFLFFILSIATYYFSSKTMKGRFANFMNVFFAGIILKLIITGIVVVIYKTANPDTRASNFIVPFAIIYFSFLIFETLELVKLSKKTN
ncbi:MAG: hypothetical protein H7Y00_02855 [Fimbriimonadaceae bacterium]|nr:hypothetical protein [Chitinophagales bacterium]